MKSLYIRKILQVLLLYYLMLLSSFFKCYTIGTLYLTYEIFLY